MSEFHIKRWSTNSGNGGEEQVVDIGGVNACIVQCLLGCGDREREPVLSKESVGLGEIFYRRVRIDGQNQPSLVNAGCAMDATNDGRGLLIRAETLDERLGDLALGIAVGREYRSDREDAHHAVTLTAFPGKWMSREWNPVRTGFFRPSVCLAVLSLA